MEDDVFEHIIGLTELAAENSDLDNNKDVEIILGLLVCCENSNYFRNKKKKREWVKQWRVNRVERGTFSFLMNDLYADSSSFLNNIKMKPDIFNYILSKIENSIRKQDTLMRKSITPEEKLAATLRYLATGESYRNTNYQTRISDSYLCIAIPEVCEAIWKNFRDEFLKFPATKSEWEIIAANFEFKWQFPHCLGALDTKHIEFRSLRKDASLFYNYKGTHSIVLLALVDANYRFIYVDVGCSGRTNDAGILLQSDLQKIIDNADQHFPGDKAIGNSKKLPYVIIGDDAFTLQKHLMKPYSHNTNKTRRKIFNIRIERARRVTDRAFKILSSRFRIFQNKIKLSVGKVELITKTCCVLHNLLSYTTENYLNDPLPDESHISGSFSIPDNKIEREAQAIRQGFEEYFIKESKL